MRQTPQCRPTSAPPWTRCGRGAPWPARDAKGWTLLRHEDVVRAAQDPETFSSAVSRHLQIPNGLDGTEHARFRAVTDPFFGPGPMAELAPRLRMVAADVVRTLPEGRPFDAVSALGSPYAVRATSAWLGWPADLEPELLQWMRDNHAATRSGDLHRTTEVAERFDRMIRTLVDARRDAGDAAPDDVTTELTRATVEGRALTDEEIVSILRNWTAGDLASIALCVGVVARYLSEHPDVQTSVRAGAGDARALDRAIDEILRIDDPFVANRRRATRDVEVGGRAVGAGDVVVFSWTAANRDPDRFGDADAFEPERNAAGNLVYGTGPHVCPGRPLATLELRLVLQELLRATVWLELAPDEESEREVPPLGGYRRAPVVDTGVVLAADTEVR